MSNRLKTMIDQTLRCKAINISIFAGLLNFILIAVLLYRGGYATPFSDEYYFTDLYQHANLGIFSVQDIIKPHFGHFYIILKTWFWVVVNFNLDWRISMYLEAAFVALASSLAVYRVQQEFYPDLKISAALATAVLVGSTRQWENFYWAIQLSSAIMICSAVFAFWFMERYYHEKKNKLLALALIFSFISVFSNGGGIAVFVLTMLALFIIVPKIRFPLIILALLGLGILLKYYILPTLEVRVESPVLDPLTLAVYFFSFFANGLCTFSDSGRDGWTVLLGGVIIGLTVVLVYISAKRGSRSVFAYLMIAFSLLSCAIVAYARLKDNIYQPTAPRYYVYVFPLLIGDLMLLGSIANQRRLINIFLLFVVCVVTLGALAYYREFRVSKYRYAFMEKSHASLCNNRTEGLAFHGNLKDINRSTLIEVFCRR